MDEEHFASAMFYVEQNPCRAGLVKEAAWARRCDPGSAARFGDVAKQLDHRKLETLSGDRVTGWALAGANS
jgi:hypothetical protein